MINSYETINHSGWSFDYRPNKNIYHTNEETFLNKTFSFSNHTNDEYILDNYRKSAVVHKIIRKKIYDILQPDVSFETLALEAEKLVSKYKMNFAFPLGISVNQVAAHDTAHVNDQRKIKYGDVVKLDLGIQYEGCIIDSAFTKNVGVNESDNIYKPLIDATRDATYSGISMSGVDACLYDISVVIEEVIQSYELDTGVPIKAIYGLGGHDIQPYKVHGGKLILSIPHSCQKNQRMKENEIYAIETYASTGSGKLKQGTIQDCNHFEINEDYEIKSTTKNELLKWINKNDILTPFTQRFINNDLLKNIKFKKDFKIALKNKYVIAYPQLIDETDGITSQCEHTIHIGDKRTEILSLGDDY